MATVASSLIVATSTKRLLIYDARYLATPVEDRESPLKGQIRAVEIHPNGASFCVGSTEGRVAIEYLDMKDAALQQKKYAFKCHRQGEKGELLFPVNALAYNPVFGTFASGGSDGQVLTWDFMNKKKLKTLSPSGPLGTPVAAMAFSCDGSMLAIAASHTFESDMTGEDKNNQIYIYRPSEAEVAPKKKK
jgi:cell cycle arrest protein BUB3